MTVEAIKATLDFLIPNKIPYDILMDNGHIYGDGSGDASVVWALDKEAFYCVRSNASRDQSAKPIEVNVVEIEHIVTIRAMVKSIADATSVLTNLGKGKHIEAISNFLYKTDYANRTSITGSTGDGINWNGRVNTKAGHLISDWVPPQVNDEEESDTSKEEQPETSGGGGS